MLNLDAVKSLVKTTYVPSVIAAFGDPGQQALERLLDGVRQIFSYCPPENFESALTVCSPLDAQPTNPLISKLGTPKILRDAKSAAEEAQRISSIKECVIEMCMDGSFRILAIDEDLLNTDEFLSKSITYRFEKSIDRIRLTGYDQTIPKIHSWLASNFAPPTYSGLEAAMQDYERTAADCKCRILAQAWEGGADGPRLVLVNKPEAIMRDSLTQALSFMLGGDASVRPEQNVDETKPVDIRVEWHGSDASALVEIKWIGRSTAKPTSETGNKYRDYKEPRAREGSKQLADYLDRNKKIDRRIKPLGYHVVFDARRKNVKGKEDKLCKEDAFHFEDSEINYDPDHSQIRDDFAGYVRFFLRPRESHLVGA